MKIQIEDLKYEYQEIPMEANHEASRSCIFGRSFVAQYVLIFDESF